ncbi:MAG TPA: type II toxin-antitoxin system Phd/YefM family antitoxin [Blastocatellia bacterium]|nr:type II toxin-antitoxin system Phd/YefM family antitoxin [Blastocatellia bacterium]
MQRADLDRDERPISDFRANAASLVQRVRRTKRPLVITQLGKGTVVLLDVAEYEKLLAKLALLQDVHAAENQLADGQAIPHAAARKSALARLGK